MIGLASILFSGTLLLAAVTTDQHQRAASNTTGLRVAAEQTMTKLQSGFASWTAVEEVDNSGGRFVSEVLSAPAKRRYTFYFEQGKERRLLSRIIQRDGLWYVTEGSVATKYRPFEAIFVYPLTYWLLEQSSLHFYSDAAFAAAQHVDTTDNIARFHVPISDDYQRKVQGLQEQFETASKHTSHSVDTDRVKRQLEAAKQLIATGLVYKIDSSNGIVVSREEPGLHVQIQRFIWLDAVDENEFSVTGPTWTDMTDDPSLGDLGELVMIAHATVSYAPQKPLGGDGCILDLKTGRYRRIPFQGAVALPGCFTKDRKSVVVSGFDSAGNGGGLFMIDLHTGANRKLGGDELSGALIVNPVLSPDGKTVAVLRMGIPDVLSSQVCLIELSTGMARFVGRAGHMLYLSWLPTGDGFIVAHQDYSDWNKPAIGTISRMDLDGNVKTVRKGTFPISLNERDGILFLDQEDSLWKTCDLEGKNVRPLGQSLKGCEFPAPAPDGKRILFLCRQANGTVLPTVITIGETDAKPLNSPGIWLLPGWR